MQLRSFNHRRFGMAGVQGLLLYMSFVSCAARKWDSIGYAEYNFSLGMCKGKPIFNKTCPNGGCCLHLPLSGTTGVVYTCSEDGSQVYASVFETGCTGRFVHNGTIATNSCVDLPFRTIVTCILGPPTPPPPPPPPPQPKPEWPSFPSLAALKASPWASYYKDVYGELPSSFPVSTEDMWMIYDVPLARLTALKVPASVGTCPQANPPTGQRYNVNNQYQPRMTSFLWHPYPYTATAANAWMEVMRQADPFGDEKFGAWFMFTPGSGVYLDLGKTIDFPEHQDAYSHFGVHGQVDSNEALCKAAAAQGYDSIQFLAHVDHVNYQCDTHNMGRAGLDYMGVEVVATKLVGTYACGTPSGAPPVIKAGWQGSRACICDNKNQFLNCQGVPAAGGAENIESDLFVL